jgi:uncharacterized protein YjbJ (UPF0337 family)
VGIEDITGKAEQLIGENKDKIEGALKSDKAEEISDKVLDGAEGFINKVTGGKFEEQVGGARDAADKKIGTE